MRWYSSTVLLLLTILLSSCAGIRNMNVQVKRPAKVAIPFAIQKIALLNRSIPTATKNIESVLTGEMPAQDKELSEECMRGLNELLGSSSRFEIYRIDATLNAADPKSLAFGLPLDWKFVDSICLAYNTDALLSIEYFDTDFSIINPGATAANAVEGLLNGNLSVQVTGKAVASAGFRMYYPKTKTIVYEDRYGQNRIWTQQSTNPVDAVAKLIKKNPALLNVSYFTGSEFGKLIIPLYFWEHRDMYKGKKGEMQRGERQALAKDWEAAIETWTSVYNFSSKNKERAKAAFNTALGFEVQGELELAQKWAQKAYIENGKSAALNYSSILDKRVREQSQF